MGSQSKLICYLFPETWRQWYAFPFNAPLVSYLASPRLMQLSMAIEQLRQIQDDLGNQGNVTVVEKLPAAPEPAGLGGDAKAAEAAAPAPPAAAAAEPADPFKNAEHLLEAFGSANSQFMSALVDVRAKLRAFHDPVYPCKRVMNFVNGQCREPSQFQTFFFDDLENFSLQ